MKEVPHVTYLTLHTPTRNHNNINIVYELQSNVIDSSVSDRNTAFNWKPGNGLGSQNVTDNNILRLPEILSLFLVIKTADVYVMRAVTNRNVCFIPECGNHQVPLCHQNGKITMDTAQFSVFVSSPVIKPPELPNCGGCIQTVQCSYRLSQVASVAKLSDFNHFYWISGRCPLCDVINMKQL